MPALPTFPTDRLEDEYRAPYEAWRRAPSPATATPLLAALGPVLDTAVRAYAGARPAPHVRSLAKSLALEAVGRYDPARAKLRTHLLSHLRGLQRHAARSSQVLRLPERVALESGRARAAEAELADELGRPPTAAELSDRTGLPPARLARLARARPGLVEGQLAGPGGEDEGDPGAPAVVSPAAREAWLGFVHGGLTPRDQLLFEHALGYNGRPVLPKVELARKVGLSPGAVSQRLARIQARIDRQGEVEGLF